jgi:hypothetical protein
VTSEGAGGIVGNEHPETRHAMRVENPSATHPVADRDHGARTATVDAASLHGTTFLLAIRQVMRPVHFWQLRHCDLSSPWWYLPAARTMRQDGRPAELRSTPSSFRLGHHDDARLLFTDRDDSRNSKRRMSPERTSHNSALTSATPCTTLGRDQLLRKGTTIARLVWLRGTCDQSEVCPTLHYQPDSDDFLIQGYTVTDPEVLARLNLPAGHTVVRVPTDLLPELPHDPDAWELLVQGHEVTDVEVLAELNLPLGETVVRVSARLLPGLRKEPQPC